MQNSAVRAVLGACLVASVFATPTPVEGESVTAAAIIRQASGSPVSGADQLSAALGSLTADYASVSAFFTVAEAIFTNIVRNKQVQECLAVPVQLKEFHTLILFVRCPLQDQVRFQS